MNILYFGDPQGAIALIEHSKAHAEKGQAPLHLCGLVAGRRGGPGAQKLQKLLKDYGTLPKWLEPNLKDPAIVSALAELKPDLLVSCFYPHRIPESVLAIAPGVNVHPSALPRWRGPDPCSAAIRAQDEMTAITVHVLSAGLDEGDVLLSVPVKIGETETGGHLAERMERNAAEIIADVVSRMALGEVFEPKPQTGEITWAKLEDPEALEIDWSKPADEVDAFIRAYSPDPGAFTGLGDELLVIFKGSPVEAAPFADLKPGTPFLVDGFCCIQCGDGALRIDRVRLGRTMLTGRKFAELLG